MLNVLLLSLLACIKQVAPGDIESAKFLFEGQNNCPERIKEIMQDSDCSQLRYAQANEYEVMFQCHKPDKKRKDFWDTMIFRVSPWSLRHTSFETALQNPRYICLDNYIIIEAFHPKELGRNAK
tara:strand:- start:471 stop:842 length:372 start_codon:yes stop_codon:yes gene_type:complete